MNLKDFSLLGQDEHSYTIGHPKGKSMTIPKQGLSDKAQELISKLKKHDNFDEGSEEIGNQTPLSMPETALPPSSQDQLIVRQEAANPTVAPPTMEASDEQAANPIQNAPTEQDIMSDYQNAQSSPRAATPAAASSPASPIITDPNILNAPAEQEEKTIQAGIAATTKAGQQTAASLGKAVKAIENTKTPQQYYDDDAKADAALVAAIPSMNKESLWARSSAPAKISAALGLVLGGIGSGLTHQPNMALQVINKAIDDDIREQENDQSKGMNLVKLHRERLGNQIAGSLAAKNNLLSVAQLSAQQAQAQAIGPQAAQNSAQIVAGIQQQKIHNMQLQSLLQFNNSNSKAVSNADPSILVQNFVPDAQKAKALEEIGKAKQAVQLKKDVIQSYNDLNNQAFAGALSPSNRQSATQTFAGTIERLSDGRYNHDSALAKADAFYPSGFEAEQTRKNKLSRINSFFDGLVQTPTLEANNIKVGKYASTSLNSANNSHLPGNVVNVKGRNYTVDADGNSLTPVK